MTMQHDPGRFDPIDRETWLTAVAADLRGKPFETLATAVAEGVRMSPLNAPPVDTAAMTAAIRGTLARRGAWDARQAFRLGNDVSSAIQEDILGGVTSVLLEGDPSKAPEETATQIAAILAALPHAGARVAIDAGHGTALVAQALLKTDTPTGLWAAFGVDPLAALAMDPSDDDTCSAALAEMVELTTGVIAANLDAHTVMVDTAVYEHAGADPVQQLAYAVATGVTYLRTLVETEVPLADAARHMSFGFRVGGAFVVEVAKLRAFRWLWARVLEASGATPGTDVHVQVRTSDRVITARDPWINMLRGTLTGFVGSVGNADCITIAPFDTALGTPDALGRRVARNTHQVLADEAYLAKVADPAAGSHTIDTLTGQLGLAAWRLFQQIEAMGGMPTALTSGWAASAVADTAQVNLRRVASRREMITGVSAFPDVDEPALPRDGDGLRDNSEAFPLRRPAAMFEELRDRTDAETATAGTRPSVFLAVVGTRASHAGRASWITNLVGVAGVGVASHPHFEDDAAMAQAFTQSGCEVAVLCGSDTTYATRAVASAGALKTAGAHQVLLAGRAGDHADVWARAGIDGYLHIGLDMRSTLEGLLDALGVTR
ncbi:MAG: methylmalonyl-CoA mutase [Myxococcota bacterium]|jgi:methylmalonyl-CoA mutase